MAPHERAGGEGEVEPEVDVNAIVVAQVETNMKGKTGKETRDSICQSSDVRQSIKPGADYIKC